MANSAKHHKGQRGKKWLKVKKGESETVTKHQAEQEAFYKRCRKIFDRLRPKLIDDYDNCFIVIEPESKDYTIDVELEQASEKARQKHPDAMLLAFRLTETGSTI